MPNGPQGSVLFSVLANDVGQDGLPADCSSAPTNNCQFDPVSADPAGQQGDNVLQIGLGGAALLLVGSSLVLAGRRRRDSAV